MSIRLSRHKHVIYTHLLTFSNTFHSNIFMFLNKRPTIIITPKIIEPSWTVGKRRVLPFKKQQTGTEWTKDDFHRFLSFYIKIKPLQSSPSYRHKECSFKNAVRVENHSQTPKLRVFKLKILKFQQRNDWKRGDPILQKSYLNPRDLSP